MGGDANGVRCGACHVQIQSSGGEDLGIPLFGFLFYCSLGDFKAAQVFGM